MNAVERAKEGYGRSSAPIRSARATEYEVIAKISHKLRSAAIRRDTDFPAYISALSDNARLWTTLAADVAQGTNALPKDLRARIFWLAEFTTQTTHKLMQGEGDVGILIEINASILQGLHNRDSIS